VGVLIAAPRLLKHATIAALLSDPIHTVMNTPNNRGSMSGGCFTSSDGGSGAGLHMASAVVSGQALKAAAAAAAQGAAAVTLSAWLSEGEGQGGQREGGQLLMMVVGDKNLQSFRRALDQHVGTWLAQLTFSAATPNTTCTGQNFFAILFVRLW